MSGSSRDGQSDNKVIVESVMGALGQGDPGPLLALLSPDVSYRIIGQTRFSGEFHGLEEFQRRVATVLGGELLSMRVEVTNVVAEGDFVVVQGRGDGVTTSGNRYANDYCWVYKLSGGRATEVTEYLDTEHVTAVFGPPRDD